MKLSELIKNCPGIEPSVDSAATLNDLDISSVTADSRQVEKGALFIAVKGFVSDGHDYMGQAFEKGAAVVIAQENPDQFEHVILVENTRQCAALVAANFYNHPSRDLTFVGLTGTNGKTTISWLIESIFTAAGYETGVIGTINIRYKGQETDNPMTTPDSIELQRLLSQMKEAGVTHVIMEVSSHSLDLNRVDGCRFDVGVFTNLTQDHLDYHPDMDVYFECKKKLFTRFLDPHCPDIQRPSKGFAVVNTDDLKGRDIFNAIGYDKFGTSTRKQTDIYSTNIKDDINGLSGSICLPGSCFDFCSALTGQFNLENILSAVGAAHALKIKPDTIKMGIEACKIIPGRLEKVENTIDRHLFVDYAHTPDALKSILTALKQRVPKRLITIFGCGGDRDNAKRPLMGKIAAGLSDIAIVTSDNPRTENPDAIISEILDGMTDFNRLEPSQIKSNLSQTGFIVEPNRKQAIQTAIAVSGPQDTIIAAGKGHETYQITNSGTIHFDDVEELESAAKAFADQAKPSNIPMDWSVEDIKKALKSDPVPDPATVPIDLTARFSGISTDSRQIKADQIFLALKGENFNGHTFIPALIEQGIKGFIVEKGFTRHLSIKEQAAGKNLLFFEAADTLHALGQLARYQRLRSKVKLVAITGSSGKTTTRKITQAIFSTQFNTHATLKNFNNEIGVPLTLLDLSKDHEWAIIEMGMNHAGEISRLSKMACPDITIITNTAGVHLEGLGTIENVARAKAEIFDGINANGTAILFAQDQNREILETAAKTKADQILFFGSGPKASVQAEDIQSKGGSIGFTVRFDGFECATQITSPARFMVDNCLAAIAAAEIAGIGAEKIDQGIRAFQPEAGRMNIYALSDTTQMIDDTYNANPASMTQALNTLARVSKNHTSMAVLGDMLELGKASDRLHYEIGSHFATLGIDHLFLFGTQAVQIKKGALDKGFPKDKILLADKKELVKKITHSISPQTWILVKGSRGMAMETIINDLKNNINPNS